MKPSLRKLFPLALLFCMGNVFHNGPFDAGEATFFGADEIGSYDGTSAVNGSDDFTARGIPVGSTQLINASSTPGSPSGNTLSLASAPAIDVPNEFYYNNTSAAASHTITFTATVPAAPAGWNVQICADNGSGTGPDCTVTGTVGLCVASLSSGWITNAIGNSAGSAGTTFTAKYCVRLAVSTLIPTTVTVTYWTVYTAPQNGLVAYTRYDGVVTGSDDQGTPLTDTTHNEMYPGWVPVTKTFSIVSNGCPSGIAPAYPALGVCPGGIIQYTIDYRNIVAGPGTGSNEPAAAMLPTAPGSLAITEDGTLSSTTQTTTANWASFSNDLQSAPTDSTAGTSFLYYTGVPAGSTGSSTFTSNSDTKFTATIGGASFQLWPTGFTTLSQGSGDIGQGTITLSVQVK